MARIEGHVEMDKGFLTTVRNFPGIGYRVKGYIGQSAKSMLYRNFLRGQAIHLNPQYYPRDAHGRRTVVYRVKRDNVTISSYPLNLFDKGRTLRSGKRAKPLRVFSRFAPMAGANVSRWNKRVQQIITEEADKNARRV